MKHLFILFALLATATSDAQIPQLLKDIYPGTSSGYSTVGPTIAVVNNKLFIPGIDADHGKEPWISDGTTAGTYLLKDMVPGITSSDGARAPFYFNGKYYFDGSDPNNGSELFFTDLTEAGTTFFADLHPGSYGSSPWLVGKINGIAVIAASDTLVNNGNKFRLYSTDGTAANTKHLIPGGFYYGNYCIVMDDKIYFSGTTDVTSQSEELWVTDGTSAGTILVKEINPGAAGGEPRGFTRLNNTQFLFTATEPTHGRELWISDGTTAGTYMLKDVKPGINSGSPGSLYNWNGKVFFNADNNGSGLWVTDGTEPGTYKIAVDSLSYPNSFVAVNGKLLFVANDGANGSELWKTDGTASGTAMLKDINPTPMVGSQINLRDRIIIGNTLFFTAVDGIHGREIWYTNGDGTHLFYDLNPGAADGIPFHPSIQLLAINNRVFFPGNDGTSGTEIFYFDAINSSVPELNNHLAATVYPNPTNGSVKIIADMHKATITTSNLLGQVVDTRNNISGESYSLDISKQPAGIYIIEVFSQGLQSRHKVVKE